jgi:hypothetical protein
MQIDAFQRGRGLPTANILGVVLTGAWELACLLSLRVIDSDPGVRWETIDSMPQFKM